MNNILNSIVISPNQNVLIFGIGNMLKGDDAFGTVLVKRLKTKLKKISIIDAEATPENHFGNIRKENPDLILIVDAVCCDLKPGEIRIFEPREIISKAMFFTHNTTLDLIMNFLKDQTKAKIFLIGVQPKEIAIKEGLSLELSDTLDRVESWFMEQDNVLCNSR